MILHLTGVERKYATVYAWTRTGRISNQGTMVCLKSYKRLGQLYTTEAEVVEFLKEVN